MPRTKGGKSGSGVWRERDECRSCVICRRQCCVKIYRQLRFLEAIEPESTKVVPKISQIRVHNESDGWEGGWGASRQGRRLQSDVTRSYRRRLPCVC